MKRLVIILLLFSLVFSAVARIKSSDAIIAVLNTRMGGNSLEYSQAVEVVAEDAKAGKIIQQYLIALLSDEDNPPKAARISKETRERYWANSRDRIFDLACAKNNSMAWYLISLEKNDMTILKHAADLGNIQALNTYATIKMSEAIQLQDASPEKSELMMKECFDLYTRVAKMNDVNALNSLGICYQKGYGCKKDEELAFRYFSKAAEMRHPEAINNLGRYYLEGISVAQDLAKALKCFEMSSSLGNAWGSINLATSILMGRGCKRDESRAIGILEKASMNGGVKAMDFLSECYAKGIGGIKKDSYKAMLWRLRARAARGDKSAKDWLVANKEEL